MHDKYLPRYLALKSVCHTTLSDYTRDMYVVQQKNKGRVTAHESFFFRHKAMISRVKI